MQFSSAVLVSLLSAVVAAAPSPRAEVVSMAADAPQWTIQSMRRVCNGNDTSCTWTFGINTNDGSAVTGCTYTVLNSGSTPASQSNGGPSNCGGFTVTSGWSGQFGPGNGFTTLSVVLNSARLIAWPAYTDNQVSSGAVVSPDLSFNVQRLG